MRRMLALAILLVPAPAFAGPGQDRPAVKDKLVCKKWADTGSLVVRKKECHTRADWAKIADSQQRGARLLAEGLTTRCGAEACGMGGNITPGIQMGN